MCGSYAVFLTVLRNRDPKFLTKHPELMEVLDCSCFLVISYLSFAAFSLFALSLFHSVTLSGLPLFHCLPPLIFISHITPQGIDASRKRLLIFSKKFLEGILGSVHQVRFSLFVVCLSLFVALSLNLSLAFSLISLCSQHLLLAISFASLLTLLIRCHSGCGGSPRPSSSRLLRCSLCLDCLSVSSVSPHS
jgi:hypothetical protein